MDVFVLTFAVLAILGGVFVFRHHQKDIESIYSRTLRTSSLSKEESADAGIETAASRFRLHFLAVYLLVMASDWLQGPYIYTLYKDEKGLAENVVAALFTTGFIAAAASAAFAGSLADKHGRRLACMCFCVVSPMACLSVLSDNLIVLFAGRVLGGVSTTLMYSVFESWMVTQYSSQQLDRSSLTLSAMFGTMTTLNGGVAIIAGVLGEVIVGYTATKTSPFMASITLCGPALWLMHTYWGENYGDSAKGASNGVEKSAFAIIFEDQRIVVLGLIAALFEGSMYLFVFFWSAALKAAHTHDHQSTALPFGLIFATFMTSMMLGSLLFSTLSAPTKSSSLFATPNFLTGCIAASSTALLVTVLAKNETVTFWCFCIFEACIGVYFPSMAAQKSRVVPDGVRAKVYGVLRVPLNVFVVAALSMTQEGDDHRDRVFLFCGGLLLLASIASGYYLTDERQSQEPQDLEMEQRHD